MALFSLSYSPAVDGLFFCIFDMLNDEEEDDVEDE